MPRHCPPGCGHVHFSALKQMARSAAHYRHAITSPAPSSAAMNLGSAVHALLLGGAGDVVKFAGSRRFGKAWDEFSAALGPDAIVLTADEWEDAQGMAAAVMAHERAKELLAGAHEQEIDWNIGDHACHGRLDVLRDREGVTRGVVELKTTTDARPAFFARTALRLGYFAQVPWYMDGVRLGKRRLLCEEGFFVAVESKRPYVVQTFQLTPSAIEFGRAQYRGWLERVAVCTASNAWPGYQETDAILDTPLEDFSLTIGGESVDFS